MPARPKTLFHFSFRGGVGVGPIVWVWGPLCGARHTITVAPRWRDLLVWFWFANFNVEPRPRVCVCVCVRVSVCVCVCACVCVVIIISLDKVTATDMIVHRMLITLTLTFIQGHIDLNDKDNKCSIISETVQAIPITFAAKIVRLKVYITCS